MIKLEWNLTSLVENEDSFYKLIEDCKEKFKEIEKYKDIVLTPDTLLELLNKEWELKELANTILVWGSLNYYKNVKDEGIAKRKKEAEKFHQEINTNLKFIDQKIIKLGKEKVWDFLKENDYLKQYELFLQNIFRLQEHIQNQEINNQIREKDDSIQEKINLYNTLITSIKYGTIEIDGKEVELTSSNIGKYLSSRDSDTRKKAYFKVNEVYKEKESDFADILNLIYDNRIKISQLEGYDSLLEKTLYEENIDPKIIETLINVTHSHLSLNQKYIDIKTKFLNIQNPHLYDFNVPLDSNLKKKYTLEEAIEIIKAALEPLGEEYLGVVDLLLDGHIDAESNENKHQSIIFSWNSYAFLNFRGAYADIKNLIHELGHIVNYYLSEKRTPFLYVDSTVFVGETASIINEVLLTRYLYNNAETEEEKIFYLSKEIENYFVSVYKQVMYTEFQHDLYESRKKQELRVDLLNEKYSTILKRYYGENIIYDDIASIEWTKLGHLYRWSYYSYKYATGLLMGSIAVDSLLDEKTLSQKQYLEFLSAGSSKYSLDLLKMLNIDLTDSSVLDRGFKILEDDINQLEKLLVKKIEH